jgi:hypothetical protein
MADSGIHGAKAVSLPNKVGAALGAWNDLTVAATRGGQTVLILSDMTYPSWTNDGERRCNTTDSELDLVIAMARPTDPGQLQSRLLKTSPNATTNPVAVARPSLTNAQDNHTRSEANAMLEFAMGLGSSNQNDFGNDSAAAEPSVASAAIDGGAVPATKTNSPASETPLDPLSDAACALSFDAALKAALEADRAAMAAELRTGNAAGAPPHGGLQTALQNVNSHAMFST